jgi:hypothetical protein
MRLAVALNLVVALAACSRVEQAGRGAEERIACASHAARNFADNCSMRRVVSGAQRLVIVSHPDDSFRRFELLQASPWIATADGAEQATFAPDNPYFEV